MTTSALDIITDAAKRIGAVFKSEVLDADEAADGLKKLNNMLDSWSNDDLLTYAMTLESFSLTGAASYTMGVGGDFNTSRPIDIKTAVVRSGSIDYPLTPLTQQQYQENIPLKSIVSTIPEFLTYDNGYPLATITLYSVPVAGTTLRMLSNKPLANLSALTTTVDLPPGWNEALEYNLARRMASGYGTALKPDDLVIARESLGAIRRSTSINNAMPPMDSVGSSRNIFTGYAV